MVIIELYNDDLRKLPNEYGDVSVMTASDFHYHITLRNVDKTCPHRFSLYRKIDSHVLKYAFIEP